MATPEPFKVRDQSATHVVIELFGGDNNLSDFVIEDLREMIAGNTGSLAVIAVADFASQGAAVVELSPRTGNRVIEQLGEINTGDPATLTSFLARALASYPNAARRAIGFWDHGSGVFDEYDPQARGIGRTLSQPARWARGRSRAARKLFVRRSAAAIPGLRAMLHDDTNGGLLTNREAGKVLADAFQQAAVASVDLIFSDTCLNGMIEVLTELAPFADVIVGSEDLEPGDGWDYALWFERLSASPPADAGAWGKLAVESFGDSYASRVGEHPVTLAAYRTKNGLAEGIKALVAALSAKGAAGFELVDRARGKAQSFARRDTYDLADFIAELRKASHDAALARACDGVAGELETARVASVAHGAQVKRAQGLAIWIPSNRYALEDVQATYQDLAFASKTGWLDYLSSYR
jgi:hypothetical protein